MQRYEASKVLILVVKYLYKPETLALKGLYQLQKIGYFGILIFGLKFNISDTLTYIFFLVLFGEKKSRAEMKSETQFSRKKQ